MKRGFSKTYRRELESDIWKMPPIYQRVFFFLRLKVKYKSELFPTKKSCGIWLNPGQWLTSIDQIARGVSWYEWGKEKIPNKKIIKDVLVWLKGNDMIVTESNAYGTYVELVNWGIYNDKQDEKVTIGGEVKVTKKKRSVDTVKELKKEVKEVKDFKEEIYSIFEFWNKQGIIIHRKFDSLKPNINAALKLYKEYEIKKAISNYKTVLKGDEFYWTYRWGLKDFLQRGLENFTEENKPLDNYKNKEKKEPEMEISTGGYDTSRRPI